MAILVFSTCMRYFITDTFSENPHPKVTQPQLPPKLITDKNSYFSIVSISELSNEELNKVPICINGSEQDSTYITPKSSIFGSVKNDFSVFIFVV